MPWRLAVAIGVTCAAALLAGSALLRAPQRQPVPPRVQVLQMNLCDSGIAGCYTGRSVDAAAALIRSAAPDVVSLNEVCSEDVVTLGQVLAAVRPGDVVQAFRAAPDRRTGNATRCVNGQAFGVGLLVHADLAGSTTEGGAYPVQDLGDPEVRVWLCVSATAGFTAQFTACTTHLASTSAPVALAQCRHLFAAAVPAAPNPDRPTIVAGDFNLKYGADPDARSCFPSGYLHVGDGDVQHILATGGLGLAEGRSVDLHGSTDHPALLATLTLTTAPPTAAPTAPPPPSPAPVPSPTPSARPLVRNVFPVAGKAAYEHTHHDYPAADIIAACGTPVVAPVDGMVLEVSRVDTWEARVNDGATRGGHNISILGDDGVRYYGAHFATIDAAITPGARVTAGQMMATVGRTGDATVCHVHFGLSPPCASTGDWWVRRGVIWPWPYLDAWRAGRQLSAAGEIAAWQADHGCPTAPTGP